MDCGLPAVLLVNKGAGAGQVAGRVSHTQGGKAAFFYSYGLLKEDLHLQRAFTAHAKL